MNRRLIGIFGLLILAGLVAGGGEFARRRLVASNPGKTLTAADYAALRAQGHRLTGEQAQAIEDHLKTHPDDFERRCQILAYGFRHRSKSAEAHLAYAAHVRWIVRNRPNSPVAGWFECQPLQVFDHGLWSDVEQLWSQHVEQYTNAPEVFGNAARFYERSNPYLAEQFFQRAHRLDPSNPEWPRRLGDLYSGRASDAWTRTWMRDQEIGRDYAARSLAAYHTALTHARGVDRLWILDRAARAALEIGDPERAARLATALLEGALEADCGPRQSYALAIHRAHTILGRAALLRNDLGSAERHLLGATLLPVGTGLRFSSIEFQLAGDLLDRGRHAVVLEYLRRCRQHWPMGLVDEWIAQIERGEEPSWWPFRRKWNDD